jgi:hypothetical protein
MIQSGMRPPSPKTGTGFSAAMCSGSSWKGFWIALLRRSDGRAYADARAALKALAACVLKIRFAISLLTRRIQIDFGGNNGKLD